MLHPITSIIIAVMHLYLAAGHLGELVAGNLEWTHVWKGFGALAGADVFMALASRRMHTDWKDMKESPELSQSQEWRTRTDGSGNYQPQGNFSFQEQVSYAGDREDRSLLTGCHASPLREGERTKVRGLELLLLVGLQQPPLP